MPPPLQTNQNLSGIRPRHWAVRMRRGRTIERKSLCLLASEPPGAWKRLKRASPGVNVDGTKCGLRRARPPTTRSRHKSPEDHADLHFEATSFFFLCYDLREWISNDPTNDLGWKSIVKVTKDSDERPICKAATKTAKHYKRHGGLPPVQISSLTVTGADDARHTSARIKFLPDKC